MIKPYFSVIIPALNEEKYIGKILNSLSIQTFRDFEVIVVDANSSDKTVDKVNKFKNKFLLNILHTKKHNLSFSRNLGAKNALGKYIFFIDADNTIPENFLEIVTRHIKNTKVNLVIPKLRPQKERFWDPLIYSFSTFLIKLFLNTPRSFSTGGNVIIETLFFNKTKGYNEKIFVGEDHDMVRQIFEKKGRMTLLTDTYVLFSMRRFEKEGILTYLKFGFAFCYLIIFRKLERRLYNYQMGGDNF